ncbi:MAG TPA: ABC transporter ATP-binding protein [Anaerolineales bacterium]|nr:ABC transporter ATP-binding protein [Anaerolineales bacterium]
MLRVERISVSYGGTPALTDVSFEVHEGEIVSIIGSNGAGKSTILKTISGLLHPARGVIEFDGQPISGLPPYKVVERGIAHVPEGRRLFTKLNVYENLLVGAFTHKSEDDRRRMIGEIFELFPVLEERRQQRAGTLSGGEQQMLAIGRALMSHPRLLMLDEPSLGIMPVLIDRFFEVTRRINQEGTTILLVEQNVRQALELANRGYVIQTGRIILEGSGPELLASDQVREAYLGL